MAALDDLWAWVEGLANMEKTPDPTRRAYRLDRMRGLLDQFGQPQLAFRTLHVAGSKGKGSTSHYLARALAAAGFRTGLYTSPHLLSYRERITLAGQPFADSIYQSVLTEIRDYLSGSGAAAALESWGGPPTTFEVLTLAGLLIFARQKCDWAVIEVGLGGRLDATNVLAPAACLITPIELEHTDILGSTLAEIAGEKAGILRPGVPVFVARQRAEAASVIEQRAGELGCPVTNLDASLDRFEAHLTPTATEVEGLWRGGQSFHWRLRALGTVQAENAALAALVLSQLKLVPAAVLTASLEATTVPGRLESLIDSPPILVDGAHTAVSAARLADSWSNLHGAGGVLLFGAFPGKDIAAMARSLAPLFPTIIITKPGTFRPSDPEAAADWFRAAGASLVLVQPETAAAWREARQLAVSSGRPLLVTGSFYLVGEVKRLGL